MDPVNSKVVDKVVSVRIDTVVELLSALNKKITTLDDKITALGGRVEALGGCCHKGFIQVRDACHVFREELAEAAGTMVEESWN